MPRTSRSNPLALAALVCLHEKNMHPYEITQTLRMRATDQAVRLNFGSLYGVIASLEKRKMIEPVETVREGKRPERTIYAVTDAGRIEMQEWLSELIAVPAKEYPQFEAALALVGALPPDDVIDLLKTRCAALQVEIGKNEAAFVQAQQWKLPRLFILEGEYANALLQTELHWIKGLIADMEAGTLDGLDGWRRWAETGENAWEHGFYQPPDDDGS
jgi:DNA-binding PadR family transcriptional regulator